MMKKYLFLLLPMPFLSCIILIGGEKVEKQIDPEIERYANRIASVLPHNWNMKCENLFIEIFPNKPETYFHNRNKTHTKATMGITFCEKQSFESYSEKRRMYDELIETEKQIFAKMYPGFPPFKDPYLTINSDDKNDSLIAIYNKCARDLWLNKNSDFYDLYTESYSVEIRYPEEYEAVFKDTEFKKSFYSLVEKIRALFYSYYPEYVKAKQI